VLAAPLAVNRLGESMFLVRRPAISEISPVVAAVLLLLVCAGALFIIARRIRRAEFAA
jgi:hypothetical protein